MHGVMTPAPDSARPRTRARESRTAREARHASFAAAVHAAIRTIPAGRVASYAGVAAMAGRPGGARLAGRVLSRLEEDTDVPWWRVLRADGRIALPGHGHADRLQRALLASEGVPFTAAGRVPRDRFIEAG